MLQLQLHYFTLHYTRLHYTRLHYSTLHKTTLQLTTLQRTTLHLSGFALPSKHHNNSPILETSATALCGTTGIFQITDNTLQHSEVIRTKHQRYWEMSGLEFNGLKGVCNSMQ